MSYAVLGDICPPCSLLYGGDCVPCPEGSDWPECESCNQPTVDESWSNSFWGAVAIGVVTTLTVTVASSYLSKRLKV